jgi:uncharacterized protein YdeI (YjbR/CyaY-like superfamily)
MAIEREQVLVTSRAGWPAWLEAHAGSSPGVWAVTARAGGVPYEDLVLEALCVGWVDSQARAVDADRSALLFTPRRPGSGWARTNKVRVEALEAAGLMRPGGRAVVETAKADGSWTLLDSVEALEEPADLTAALDATPGARTAWDAFPGSARKAMLTWLVTARRPETRERRVTAIAERAAVGERAHP